MALLKVSEFAEKYNIRRTNIYTYSNRNKLIIIDGYLDEENAINKIFIQDRETSTKVKVRPSANIEIESNEQPVESDQKEDKPDENKQKISNGGANKQLLIQYEKTNKLKDEKLQEEIRSTKIRNDKLEGRLVPVDAVKQVLTEIVSKYKMTFLQQTEQLIRDIMNELLAPNEKITSTCSKLVDIANLSNKQAITEAKANILNIINENRN